MEVNERFTMLDLNDAQRKAINAVRANTNAAKKKNLKTSNYEVPYVDVLLTLVDSVVNPPKSAISDTIATQTTSNASKGAGEPPKGSG